MHLLYKLVFACLLVMVAGASFAAKPVHALTFISQPLEDANNYDVSANQSTSSVLFIRESGIDYGAYLKWDLSALKGYCIDSGTISLNTQTTSYVAGYHLYGYRFLRDWTTAATNLTYDGTNLWDTPHGRGFQSDISSTPLFDITLPSDINNVPLNKDELKLMIASNKGINIWNTGGGYLRYDSMNTNIATNRPKLVIQYSNCPTPSPTDSPTPTPTPTAKLPVILIPGGMGSKLAITGSQPLNPIQKEKWGELVGHCVLDTDSWSYKKGDLIWIDEDMLHFLDTYPKISKPCSNFLDVLQFDDMGQPIYPQVGVNGEIVDAKYKSAKEYLTNKNSGYPGYTEGKDLFIFPYDWRKSINDSSEELEASISGILSQTHAEQVDILAHSMGGLVARKYISDQTRAQTAHTLVELGTPHAGFPKILAQLLYNICPIKEMVFFCVPNGQETNKLMQNFPAVYQMLPSQFYYQLYPLSADYPFSDDRDMDNDSSTTGALTYNQTRQLLSNLGKNMTMFDIAQTFHNTIDWTNTSTVNGVNTYLIAGSGQATIGQIHDYNGVSVNNARLELPFLPQKQDADSINGDDTVPIKSAILSQQETSQPNVFYSNQTHMDLMKNDALKMAVRLLEGNSDSSGLNIQKTPFNYSGTIIGIYSPAVLHAYDDQDNHTGLKNDGTIEVNIPGSSYEELGESKFIYLPNGGHYRLTTKATGEGSFDLKIKNYSDSTLTSEQLYLDIPQTTQTTTSLSLDTPSPVLLVDTNNDGTVDQQIQVTSTLTGEDVADTTPPVTQVQKTGTQGTNDWYTSNVSLTLTSQDDNAGILKTLYYFDGESTIYTYTEPINLTSEGTTKLWYFSVDKAGNAEQPKSTTVKIDKTNPTITYTGRTEANSNDWNKTDVTVNWTCADEISGVANSAISETINTEGENKSVTGTCIDKAGNSSTDTQSGINIDKTDPSLTISAPQNNATYILKSAVNADWNTNDTLSGISSNNGTVASGSAIDTSTVGSHSFTVSVTDKADNTKSTTITYKVIYRFDGFLQPINDTGHTQTCGANCTVSVFKGGSTVPVKFQLKDANGNIIQSANPPQWITPQQGSAIADSVNETDFTDPTDSGTVYNWDGSQYHYNWKTKDIPSGYHWLIGVRLDDGQTYTVNIGLR